jgi:hypothetical protein
MSSALQHYEGGSQLAVTAFRKPSQVLAEAQEAAAALKQIITDKPEKAKVYFNGEQYLEREDWGTVARFYSCTAKTVETKYVEYGYGPDKVCGFEATAIVIDINTGMEIGRAESMCLDEEATWGKVPVYDWQDKLDADGKKIWNPQGGKNKTGGYEREKVQTGETTKPLFQLRSMAQTRAEAKALKQVFSWVVVLAGYKATPAEEMTGNELEGEPQDIGRGKPQVQQPSRTSDKKTQPQGNGSHEIVSDEIEAVRSDSNKNLWLSLKSCKPSLVVVKVDRVHGDMKPGAKLKFDALKSKNDRIGEYYDLQSLIDLIPAPEVEPARATEPAKVEPATEVHPEIQGMMDDVDKMDSNRNASIDGLFGSGAVTTGDKVPPAAAKKEGVIGSKRAQRLYAMMSQNKDKNNGFNEKECKRILGAMTPPLEHLSDLPLDFQATIENYATGEKDWREFWSDDPIQG